MWCVYSIFGGVQLFTLFEDAFAFVDRSVKRGCPHAASNLRFVPQVEEKSRHGDDHTQRLAA